MNTDTPPAFNTKQRVPALDGIRGLAILLVLVWHYFNNQIKADPNTLTHALKKATNLTWSGVDLFFVLSGFLIGGLLIENRNASNLLKVFYVRRACRIFPLYFLWVAIFMVCVYFVDHPRYNWLFKNPLPLWSYLTYLQNFVMAHEGGFGSNWMGITWSLAVEEQFYLILPFLMIYTPRKWIPPLLTLLILATPQIRMWFFYHHPNVGLPPYVLLPCRWDALFIGVLGAYGIRQASIHRVLKNNLWLLYGIFVVLGAAVAYLGYISPKPMTYHMTRAGYTCLAAFYLALIYTVLLSPNRIIQALTQAKVFIMLGTVSYGIYIFHQSVTCLCHIVFLGKSYPEIRDWSTGAVTCLSLGATLLLAYVSYRYFESPFIRLGHNMKYANPGGDDS